MKAWKKAIAWFFLAGFLMSMNGAALTAQAEGPQLVLMASSSYPGSFSRNLYKGCTGSDVRVLQQLLKNLGYYTGAVDGIFGSNTRTAVQNFQRRNGLGVDGIAGRNTFRILLSGDAIGPSGGSSGGNHLPPGRSYLQFGDENEQVLSMQTQLKALGYYTGPLTGYFGTQTRTAVRAFQARNSISVDGLAGRITLNLMFSGHAIPAQGHVVPTATPTPGTTWRILRYGMIGTDVAEAQTRLFNLGYYKGRINGEFNSDMRTAVMNFQARNWLTVDGIIGNSTYIRLFSANAVPADQCTTPTPSPTPTPTPWWVTPTPTPTPWWVTPTPSPTPTPWWVTPTPSPTPTVTPGATCQHCKKTITNIADHVLAECGVAGHYRCTNTAPQLHLASTKCIGCGKYACQGGDHSQLACGHLACQPGNHTKAACNTHYNCNITAPDMHLACSGCGQYACTVGGDHSVQGCGHKACQSGTHLRASCGNHWQCQINAADMYLHMNLDDCQKHYACSVTAPELHKNSSKCPSCGKFGCEGGDHSLQGCGHRACESGTHQMANCGTHWQCQVASELNNHMQTLRCGKHYLCSVSAPDMHNIDPPCPY